MPNATPESEPVEPMVAIAVLPLLHAPPVVASVNEDTDPLHTPPMAGPVIAGGVVFTVMVFVTMQPVPGE